jgi:monoamine oxidase
VSFPQHDDGTALQLTDPERPAEPIAVPGLHGRARRLANGMATLVEALVSSLPADALHLQYELLSLRQRDDLVEVSFRCGEVLNTVMAHRVVLAIPPRLIAEHVRFEPPLHDAVYESMRATHTWMAEQAKVMVGFDRPFWREAGLSGNAFVRHEQATLGEIFDACDDGGEHAALGAFFALPPTFRAATFPGIVPLMVSSQLVQLFGKNAEHGAQILQDWSTQRFTCSSLDRSAPTKPPQYGDPLLQQALWDGRLFLGGTETATRGGGHMEGALDAAARIAQDILDSEELTSLQLQVGNAQSVAQFRSSVTALRGNALAQYRQHLTHHLAAQRKADVTRHALRDTVDYVYQAALAALAELPFDTRAVAIHRGRSDLTPNLLACFEGFNSTLLGEVIDFNRRSCAMSNFPHEHCSEPDYLDAIKGDLVHAWRAFALNLNDILVRRHVAAG